MYSYPNGSWFYLRITDNFQFYQIYTNLLEFEEMFTIHPSYSYLFWFSPQTSFVYTLIRLFHCNDAQSPVNTLGKLL